MISTFGIMLRTAILRLQKYFFYYRLIFFLCFPNRYVCGSTWVKSMQLTVWKLANWNFLKKMWISENLLYAAITKDLYSKVFGLNRNKLIMMAGGYSPALYLFVFFITRKMMGQNKYEASSQKKESLAILFFLWEKDPRLWLLFSEP